MSKYTGFSLGLVLLTLIAFKPWPAVNKLVGLQPPPVTTVADKLATDSLMLETVPMVLTTPVADTLAAQVARRQRYHEHLVKEDQALAEENEALAARERKQQQLLAQKKKRIEQAEQHLVSPTEVDELVARQKKPPLRGGSNAIDSRTGLLKEPERPFR